MWTLPSHFPSANEMVELAAAEGVGLYSLEGAGAYETRPLQYSRALLLGYGALTPEEIRKGISQVARALTRAGSVCGHNCSGALSNQFRRAQCRSSLRDSLTSPSRRCSLRAGGCGCG